MKKLFSITMVLVLMLGMLPATGLAASGITVGQSAGAPKPGHVTESPNGVYIIQMLDEPVVAYEGGIRGLPATAPAKGQKSTPGAQLLSAIRPTWSISITRS